MDSDHKLIIKGSLKLIATIPVMYTNDFTWKHFNRTPKRTARRELLGTWLSETKEEMLLAKARLEEKYPETYKKK